MERIQIFGTADRKIPDKMLAPRNFDNDKYDCKYVFRNKDMSPVAVMRSKDAHPARWRVLTSRYDCYFLTMREALAYCNEKGFTLVTGGEKR